MLKMSSRIPQRFQHTNKNFKTNNENKIKERKCHFFDIKQAYDSVPRDLLYNYPRSRNVLNDQEIEFLQAWYD